MGRYSGGLALFSWLEPRRTNLIASRKFYVAGRIGAPGHVSIVVRAVGRPVDVATTIAVAVSLLIMVLGHFTGKTRSAFLVGGLRLPWTPTRCATSPAVQGGEG